MTMRLTPVCSVVSKVIGNNNVATTLFVTTLLIKNVAKYTAPNKPAYARIGNGDKREREQEGVDDVRLFNAFMYRRCVEKWIEKNVPPIPTILRQHSN